jgi:hypothetical protein
MLPKTKANIVKWYEQSKIPANKGKIFFVYVGEVSFTAGTPPELKGPMIAFSKTEITLSNYVAVLKKEVERFDKVVGLQVILGRVGRKAAAAVGGVEGPTRFKYHYAKATPTEGDNANLRVWGQTFLFFKGAAFEKAKIELVADSATGAAAVDFAKAAAAKKAWLASGATAKKNFASMLAVIKADADVRASAELRAAVAALKVARVEEYTKALDAAFTLLEAVAPKRAGAPLEKPLEYAKALRDFKKALGGLKEKFNRDKQFRAIDFDNPWGNAFDVTKPIDQGFQALMSVYLPGAWKLEPYVRS